MGKPPLASRTDRSTANLVLTPSIFRMVQDESLRLTQVEGRLISRSEVVRRAVVTALGPGPSAPAVPTHAAT